MKRWHFHADGLADGLADGRTSDHEDGGDHHVVYDAHRVLRDDHARVYGAHGDRVCDRSDQGDASNEDRRLSASGVHGSGPSDLSADVSTTAS